MNCSRRFALILLVLMGVSVPIQAHAQTMQEVLNRLFIFSGGEDPLFLAGSAGNPAFAVHGDHFIPSEAESNGALLGVFANLIASNISNFPLSSTVSSQTFKFVDGVPTPTSNSFGPIFSERAQTLGGGRFDVGFSYSSMEFDQIRGTGMDDIQFNFLHQNVDFPACAGIFGADCEPFGFPLFEHDVINLKMDLRIRAQIYSTNATVGITDWLDFGVAIPVISIHLDGNSSANIIPSTVGSNSHFFGGDETTPILSATSSTRGSALGIGDVAVRSKIRLLAGEEVHVSVLGEVRLPTGREEDFLGSGETSIRSMFIASATMNQFEPHVNVAHVIRTGQDNPNSFQFAAGFDQRISNWATFVVDLLGDVKMSDSAEFPDPATFDPPVRLTVERANIANRRDDTVDAAFGFKFRTQGGIVVWANAMVALNDGGLRDRVISTFGFQYSGR